MIDVAAARAHITMAVEGSASTNGIHPESPLTLAEARTAFRKWLGKEYDTGALDAVFATLAAERLDGDPLWLLVISGSGNAKTETVQAAHGFACERRENPTAANRIS